MTGSHPVNHISIEHLLNPEGENTKAARMWSNKEIFELVKEESRQESAFNQLLKMNSLSLDDFPWESGSLPVLI